jgi:hypothetical protein
MSSPTWPTSPLDAAQRAFDLLTCPPAPLAFDGRGFAGLPDQLMPLDELRKLLLLPHTAVTVRDSVWRELVIRSRRDGPAWVVAAVGMAIPGLRHTAGMLTTGWKGDVSDLNSELLVGFLERLKVVDVDQRRICGRLIDAGARAAKRMRERYSDEQLVHVAAPGPRMPMLPWDHPDWVLARAVVASVLDPEEANLIAATRLGTATLAEAASALGMDAVLAASWRRTAELRLRDAIRAGELDHVSIAPRRRANRAVLGAAVGSLLGSRDGRPPLLGAQQKPLGGKTSVRARAGVGAPGIVAAPAG